MILIPRDTIYGIGILMVVMLGAMYTHVANGEGLAVLRPVIFIFFLFLLGWLRRAPPAQTQTT
jgi:hypothetical protein